jgi:hypothetical protein
VAVGETGVKCNYLSARRINRKITSHILVINLFVCLYIPPLNFLMAEPIIMKLDVYIYMAPGPISTAYFINPFHQSICLY